MKKLLLTFIVLATTYMASAQVIFRGISPTPIVKNYKFTWAEPAAGGWTTPNLLTPGVNVQDTLMMVEDGSLGTNPYGNPYSQEGCNALTNNLAGKIAVVYRGTCNFSAKALSAQNAGAVAVIIVNRDPDPIPMAAGTNGSSVTIPVVMLGKDDGAALVAAMANGPVEVFIGNKTGLFQNDLTLSPFSALAPKAGMIHSALAKNGTDFNFEIGASVYNSGNTDQSNVSLTAKVLDPSGNEVYNESVTGISIIANDTVDVAPGEAFNLPQFSLNSYPVGTYTLLYDASLGGTDEFNDDNAVRFTFTVNDSVFSYAGIDTVTKSIEATQYYRPASNTSTFSICSVLKDPNASRVSVEGLYFAAAAIPATAGAPAISLQGEEIVLHLYEWNDPFVDLSDNTNYGYNNLAEIGNATYDYPSDLQEQIVYGAFNTPIILEDDKRYLACAQRSNTSIYFGYATQNYSWNEAYYLQPMFPIENNGTFNIGFGPDLPSGLGIKLSENATSGLNTSNTISGVAYPNPANDEVTVAVAGEGVAKLTVADITGKVAFTNTLNLVNGKSNVNISSLDAGVYVFNVVLENGKTSQFNVVKK
jgi:hypothetical protein